MKWVLFLTLTLVCLIIIKLSLDVSRGNTSNSSYTLHIEKLEKIRTHLLNGQALEPDEINGYMINPKAKNDRDPWVIYSDTEIGDYYFVLFKSGFTTKLLRDRIDSSSFVPFDKNIKNSSDH